MLLLTKILSLLLYPLSFSLFLLLLAFLFRLRGERARSASLTLIGTVWLYFCSTEFGASGLSGPLESAYPAFANEELPTAQAAVILGGATTESRYGLGGDLNHAADRLWRGAALYYAEKAPLIVLTGGTLTGGRPEALLMAQKLREIGIPDAAILREAESRTTREHAQVAKGARYQPHFTSHQCLPYAPLDSAVQRTGLFGHCGRDRPPNTAICWPGPRLAAYGGPACPIQPSDSRVGRISGVLVARLPVASGARD